MTPAEKRLRAKIRRLETAIDRRDLELEHAAKICADLCFTIRAQAGELYALRAVMMQEVVRDDAPILPGLGQRPGVFES